MSGKDNEEFDKDIENKIYTEIKNLIRVNTYFLILRAKIRRTFSYVI